MADAQVVSELGQERQLEREGGMPMQCVPQAKLRPLAEHYARVPRKLLPPLKFVLSHNVGLPVGESQQGKRAKSAFATKGGKFASLTINYIHKIRPHERRSATPATRGIDHTANVGFE